jgi:hypothetical protein
MAAMSNTLENKLIDWLFRGQAIGLNGASAAAGSGPTQFYVALFTAIPGETGGGTEVVGGSYVRKAISSSMVNWAGTQAPASTTASSGSSATTTNNVAITFDIPTANWGIITSFALFDAVTGGNMLIYGALSANKTVNNGDAAPSFAGGALSFQVDN